MDVVAWALIGYAAGCVPEAWLVAAVTGRRELLDGAGRRDAIQQLMDGGARLPGLIAVLLGVVKAAAVVLAAQLIADPYAAGACAAGVLAGACWPVGYRSVAGTGLVAAAGGLAVIVPVELLLAGIVAGAAGVVVRHATKASTVALVAVPLLALLRGQPGPVLVVTVAILAIVIARRLEGVGGDVQEGASIARAGVRRAIAGP